MLGAVTVAAAQTLPEDTPQRSELLDARDNGTFDADAPAVVPANLDAARIALEMRGGPAT